MTSWVRNRQYCSYTGLSNPKFLLAFSMQSGLARCPQASFAGSAGMMKKITYATSVIVKKRTIAQRIRRTRYWNTRPDNRKRRARRNRVFPYICASLAPSWARELIPSLR